MSTRTPSHGRRVAVYTREPARELELRAWAEKQFSKPVQTYTDVLVLQADLEAGVVAGIVSPELDVLARQLEASLELLRTICLERVSIRSPSNDKAAPMQGLGRMLRRGGVQKGSKISRHYFEDEVQEIRRLYRNGNGLSFREIYKKMPARKRGKKNPTMKKLSVATIHRIATGAIDN